MLRELARVLLFGQSRFMKISALALAKLHRTLGALILSVSASLAQNTVPAAPIAPPAAPSAVAPVAPISPLAPSARPGGGSLAPAPIEPPLQTPAAVPAPGDPTAAPGTLGTLDLSNSHVSEFQGDDVSLVLRTLARQAKMNVVVSPAVTGVITLRVENKTPSEVMRINFNFHGINFKPVKRVGT